MQFIGYFWQFLDENRNIGNRTVSHIILLQSSAPSWLTPQLSFGDRWQQKRLLDGKLIPLTLVLAQCIEFHLFWINSKKKQIHYKLEKYNTNTSVIKDSVVGWSPWQMAPLPDCQLSSLLPLRPATQLFSLLHKNTSQIQIQIQKNSSFLHKYTLYRDRQINECTQNQT